MGTLVVGASGDAGGSRFGRALVGANHSITSANGALMRALIEVGVELTFVVIEKKKSPCVMWLFNHP